MIDENWATKYDAPPGAVWVCGGCGKTASNKAEGGLSHGWDVSCFLNAVLCQATQRDGRWEEYVEP